MIANESHDGPRKFRTQPPALKGRQKNRRFDVEDDLDEVNTESGDGEGLCTQRTNDCDD